MQQKADGMNYAPRGKARPVCGKGEFPVGVVGLDHGHIYGMCNGLSEAGADIELVYDPDPAKVGKFIAAFPIPLLGGGGREAAGVVREFKN